MDVNSVSAVDSSFVFADTNDLSTTFILRDFTRVRTYVTKSLDDHCFAFDTNRHTHFVHVFFVVQRFTYTIVYSSTCCFFSTTYTVQGNWFTCYTTCSINILSFERSIRIEDPSHFSTACSVIWRRYINCRSYKVSANKLSCISSSNFL